MPTDRETFGQTILIVDDDPLVRGSLVPVLAKRGYSVIQAEGGRQGVERFTEHPARIDLVLCDITMPDMDGVQTVAQIRLLRDDTNILFMSGQADTLPPWACETCGFLLKPFRVPQLLEAVRQALDSGARSRAQA